MNADNREHIDKLAPELAHEIGTVIWAAQGERYANIGDRIANFRAACNRIAHAILMQRNREEKGKSCPVK